MKESWVGKLLLGILVSIVAWAATNIYLYYDNRWKIEEVILLDINMHSQKLQEMQEFCNKYIDIELKENKIIDNCVRYSKDDIDIYKLMLPEIAKYLSKGNIIKIMKYYNELYEYSFLMEGLSGEIMFFKEKQIVIKPDDLTYFKDKNNRINKIIKIIAQKNYKSIDDLPDDYKGIIPPESLVK
jgi:hypothetical protein